MSTAESTATIDRVVSLYEQGLYLQAYEAARPLGPLPDLKDPAQQILGGRLANHLGVQRLGRVLHRRAYKQAPQDPEVVLFYTFSMSSRRSPLETLDLIEAHPFMNDAPLELQADWVALHARTLALLRDFEAAEQRIETAMKLTPERAWIWVERTVIFECEDRHDEGVESARHALQLRPLFRPALQHLAYRLVQLNRDDEALEVLEQAADKLESGDVLIQLAALHHEMENYEQARALYNRIEEYWPLMEYSKGAAKWLACRKADAAYFCGDLEEAARQAKLADNPFFDRLAERLENPELEPRRVHLPVKFVQQHHLTCAPATLSALSDYWSQPAPHVEVSEEICYDGTPAHSERRWAEENGFAAREFRVTWEAAVALLDREIPFTLTTVDPGNAHLQAIIGYDNQRGSLLLQDPGNRHVGEFAADKMLEHYGSSGPRGMAMVPQDQADRYDGIELPEAELYDLYYQLELALEKHQRDEAERWHEKMKAQDAGHRLTLRARGNLANYDSDWSSLLECTEALLKLYPEDVNLQLSKLQCMQDLQRREDRMAWLKEQVARPNCDPLFWVRYAQALTDDAREYDNVLYLLRRAMQFRPHDGLCLYQLGVIRWEQERLDEAARLYRFAACVDEMNETPARVYFQAARHLGQTDVALQFLTDRFRRFGEKSPWPTRTLCWAYDQIERVDDAFTTVRSSLKQHSEDGDLMLFAADFFGRYGNFEEADPLMERAETRTKRSDWLRMTALLSLYRGELSEALGYWQAVVETDPLDYSAQDTLASLLADLEGTEAAVAHLRDAVSRFPHSIPLNTLLIEWLREDPAECEAMLRSFLQHHPADPWAHRELAVSLYTQQRFDEALAEADVAQELDPSHHLNTFLRGKVAEARGDIPQARDFYRQTIRASVDFDTAVVALIGTCDTKEERQQELRFVHGELKQQVTFGDGLLTYRAMAQNTLTPDQLWADLQEAQQARPDLWHAWSAVIQQLCDMQRLDEALEWAQQAVAKFPLLPRIWMDLARVCDLRNETDQEIEALQRAWQINPAWSEPARMLSEAYEKQKDLERSRETLERAIACEPKDSRNHGCLASVLWDLGQREEAVTRLESAARIEPQYQWAWDTLRAWYAELERPERLAELAREVANSRPREARSWMLLAELLDDPEQVEEAYAALQRAIEIKPRMTEAYSLWAFYLTREGKFDEAIARCDPEVFRGKRPLELHARAAWIEGHRGDIDRAIAMMQEVVQQDPEYFWAWSQLCELTEHREDLLPIYCDAAQQLTRLAPQLGPSWGYLADAELRRGNRDLAKEHFHRAVEVSPDYLYAGNNLVEMHLEDDQCDAAWQTMAVVGPHMPAEWAASLDARITIKSGDKERALSIFRELGCLPSESTAPLDAVGEAFWQAGWADEAEQCLREMLEDPQAQPAVGFVWVNLCSTLELWAPCMARLDELPVECAVWSTACAKFVREAAQQGQPNRMIEFVEKHRLRLQADDKTWAAVGDALSTSEDFSGAIEWLSDWQCRAELEPSYLIPLVLSYWELKQPQAATEVALAGMQGPSGLATAVLQIWAAAYYLLYEDPGHGHEMLVHVPTDELPEFYQDALYLFGTMSSSMLDDVPYREVCQRIEAVQEKLNPMTRDDRVIQWIIKRYRARLAKLQGRTLTTMWLALQRLFE